MNEPSLILPEWVAAQVAAAGGAGVDLQQLMDHGPFRPASVRTVAESGDFQIIAGKVHRCASSELGTWLPARDPQVEVSGSQYRLSVPVTEEMYEGKGIIIPRSIAGMLEVPRWYHRTLESRLGKRAVHLSDTEARLGPIADFLVELGARVGEHVTVIFDRDGHLDVTR